MTSICKNCGVHFKGHYCSNCAQKATTGRLKVRNVLHELWHNFTHTDKGILGLIVLLFKNPGKVIREYIEGKRKKYFNPYTFFLIATSILLFITGKVFDYENVELKINNEFGEYVSRHYNIIIFACFPVLAFILKLVFFKSRYNYAEWIIFFVFTFGFINLTQIIIQLLYFPLIKYHYAFSGYTRILGYVLFIYILLSFLYPLNTIKIIQCLFAGVLVYFFVDKIGSAAALWYWGMPFKQALNTIF